MAKSILQEHLTILNSLSPELSKKLSSLKKTDPERSISGSVSDTAAKGED